MTITAVVLALVTALIMTPMAIAIAKKLNIVDNPNARKVHKAPIPRMGGIAIYLAFVVGVMATGFYTRKVAALLIACTLVMLIGLIDDMRGVSPKAKLIVQVIAALVLISGGSCVRFITNPFTGGVIHLSWLGIPITVLWLAGMSNAVNLVDGLDGLSGGISAIAACTTAVVCVAQGEVVTAALAAVLAADCVGFLRYNFHPAKTFMGDCGSLFLGFTLGSLGIMGLSKGATVISIFIPLIIMGIPLFDTCFAIIRRMFLKKPIFEADKGHLHHRLLSFGFSHKQTVLVIYALSAMMGACAILMAVLTSAQSMLVLILLTVSTFAFADAIGVLRGEGHGLLQHHCKNS